jgi:hypothetical protein
VYVVKDGWSDSRRKLEGDIYKAMGEQPGIAKLYSYGIVQIDGQNDSTDRIRRGLKPNNAPVVFQTFIAQGRRRKVPIFLNANNQVDPNLGSDSGIASVSTSGIVIPSSTEIGGILSKSIQNKLHVRHAMQTIGTPIRLAATLRQIVRAFLDAIKGKTKQRNLLISSSYILC